MFYLKIFLLLFFWAMFFIKIYNRIKSIYFKGKIITQIRGMTDEAIVIMSSQPMKIEDVLSLNKCDAARYINCELNEQKYSADNEIKEIISSYARCFKSADVHTVKNNLLLLKAKLEILEKTLSRKKNDVLKNKLPVSILLVLCVSIIII